MPTPINPVVQPKPAAAPAAANATTATKAGATAAAAKPLAAPAAPAKTPVVPPASIKQTMPVAGAGAKTPSNPAPAGQAQMQGMLNKVAAGQVLTPEESAQYGAYAAANGKPPVIAGVPQKQQPAQAAPAGKATPKAGTTPATPAAPQPGDPEFNMKDVDDLNRERDAMTREAEILRQQQVQGETEAREALTQIADNTYAQKAEEAKRAEELYAIVLAQRNAALEATAQIERNDAEISYQAQKFELEETRKREQEAYKNQIVEQKLNNTNRTLKQESMMAALGGFGSMWANKEIQDLTLANDRVVNEIFFEQEMADENMAFNINQVTQTYQNDLFKIESNKQQLVNQNYSEYLSYINEVQNRRDLALTERQNLIIDAQAQYKQNVSAINASAFQTRYEVSTQARQYADGIRTQIVAQNDKKQSDARSALSSLMSGFSISADPLSTTMIKKLSDLEKAAGMPVGTAATIIKGIKKELTKQNVQISTANDDGDLVFISTDTSNPKKPVIKEVGRMAGMGSATQDSYQIVTQKDMYGNEYSIAVNKQNPNDQVDLRTGLPTSGYSGGTSSSAKTSDTSGMQVVNQNDPNGDNCVLFARRFVPNLPTGLYTKADKQAAVQKYGSTDMSQVKVGDAVLTGEGSVGHVVVVTAINGTTITLKEANYKSGMVTEGRQLDINDPVIYGFVSNTGGSPKSVGTSSSGRTEGQAPAVESDSAQSGNVTFESAYAEAVGRGLTGPAAAKFASSSVAAGKIPLDKDLEKAITERFDKFESKESVKTYKAIKPQVDFALKIDPNTKNSADHMAMIYKFAKIMDPNSAVKEGEYDTISDRSMTMLERFGFNVKKVASGTQFLTADAIRNMQKTIKSQFDEFQSAYDEERNLYGSQVERMGHGSIPAGTGKDYFSVGGSSESTPQPSGQPIQPNGRAPLTNFESKSE